MKFRWTMKELKELSNKRLILGLITERKNELHPYAPLATRLEQLEIWVKNNIPDN